METQELSRIITGERHLFIILKNTMIEKTRFCVSDIHLHGSNQYLKMHKNTPQYK